MRSKEISITNGEGTGGSRSGKDIVLTLRQCNRTATGGWQSLPERSGIPGWMGTLNDWLSTSVGFFDAASGKLVGGDVITPVR